MQLKRTLGRISRHLPGHGTGKGVVIMEPPRKDTNESWRYTQARWSPSAYDDPWPTRG